MLPGNQILKSLELLAKVELANNIRNSGENVNPPISHSDRESPDRGRKKGPTTGYPRIGSNCR